MTDCTAYSQAAIAELVQLRDLVDPYRLANRNL